MQIFATTLEKKGMFRLVCHTLQVAREAQLGLPHPATDGAGGGDGNFKVNSPIGSSYIHMYIYTQVARVSPGSYKKYGDK